MGIIHNKIKNKKDEKNKSKNKINKPIFKDKIILTNDYEFQNFNYYGLSEAKFSI